MIWKNTARGSSGRARWRIAIVAAVAVVLGGTASIAEQTAATQPQPVHRDQLLRLEQMGCREMVAFPKRGWLCMR